MNRYHLVCIIIVAVALMVQQVWSTLPRSELVGKHAPELAAGDWTNSKSLLLRGQVVLVEFWTFWCFNCRNTIPYLRKWHGKYRDAGFTIIGVHTPELDREKDLSVVEREIARLGIEYPVVTDNDYATWNRYYQQSWPVLYLLDKQGIIRYVNIGEGNYTGTDRQIASLVAEQ